MINLDQIQKSLVDQNIPVIEYNPKIVINQNIKNIKTSIIENLQNAIRVDIAVSYVVWSGLQQIITELSRFNKDSRIIITTDGFVTDVVSLRKLNELKINTKVYAPKANDKGFHLKSYSFEYKDYSKLIIGSSNISMRAFGLAHEMVVEIDSSHSGKIIEDYQNIFQTLWDDESSINLNEDFINKYELDFNKNHQFLKDQFESIFSKKYIKPNFMQVHALESIEQSRDDKKGLVIAATGTGKTYLSAFDVMNFNPRKVLFMAHNRLILTSAKKTYDSLFGEDNSIELNSRNLKDHHKYKYIFTTDKTANDYLISSVSEDYFDYIVYDEAHKIGEDTKYSNIFQYFKPKYSLGITATPERTKRPEYLFETFNYSIPYEIRLLDALNNELICPFTYFGYNIPNNILDKNEKFLIPELAKYIKYLINTKGHYGNKTKGIIFCKDTEEAKELSFELAQNNFKSTFVTSSEDSLKRDEIEEAIKELASDEPNSLEFICVVNKFNEGIDIPEINTIFMLRNTESSIIYLQQLGRGLRKTQDPNKFVTVYDLIGNSKNNYTIAQVLTGNTTADKRKLYQSINHQFNNVSPFLNVHIEKEAIDKIIQSISNNFKVKTEIKNKFISELHRFKYIPTLKELYLNQNFSEIELLQLLFKDFYTPFQKHYIEKYNISKDNLFLKNFFTVINQFVFRGYSHALLLDYIRLLEGESVKNQKLSKILLYGKIEKGISTAVISNYYKQTNNFTDIFIGDYLQVELNPKILMALKEENAYQLFLEHTELFRYVLELKEYEMKPFDLIDKAEFLFLNDSDNCFMMLVGELINHKLKKVYCPITISKERKNYSNRIDTDNTLIYCTQKTKTKEMSFKKDKHLIDNNYKFHICAKFPHLGYESTTYFNLDKLEFLEMSKTLEHPDGGFYHELKFKIINEVPSEILKYKEITL